MAATLTDQEFDAARPAAASTAISDEEFDAVKPSGAPKKKRTSEEILNELYPEPPGPLGQAVEYAGGLLSRIGSGLSAAFRAKAPEVEPLAPEPLPERGVAQGRPAAPAAAARPTMPTTDLPGLEGEMPPVTQPPPAALPPRATTEGRPDMPEAEATRDIAARFGRGPLSPAAAARPEGISVDRGPTPQEGLLARALTAVGLRDPAAVQQRRAARENAQAALAVNGMEPLQSEIPGQVLSGISSGVTAGLDEALLDAFGYTVAPPRTTAGGIARGLGHLGGFVAGAPMAAGKATGEAVAKAFTEHLGPRITSSTAAAIAGHLGKAAATLGAATGTAETGKALQQEDILSAAKTYGQAAGRGALLGTVFGAIPGTQSFAETLNVGTTAAHAARYGLGLALTDLAQGHYPGDGRSWEDQAFDYALNAFFLFQGRNAPSLLRQIENEASRRGVKPDDLFRGISDQMVVDHIAAARAARPGLFDAMATRYQERNPGFTRQMAEYQAARNILGEPGVGHGVATEATAEPAPPPPPQRGVAPVTFVGYDQTKSPAEPMFTVAGDLQMPWGPAARGQLIPGQLLIEAGYGLPDYPQAPKGGGHTPGLVPESENAEERTKQAETVVKDADKAIAEAEKEGKTAVKDLDPETLPEPPWTVPEPQDVGPQGALVAPTPEEAERFAVRLETAASRFPTEEELPDWQAQIGETIAQGEQYAAELPETHPGLDAALAAAKLIQRAAQVDPDGFLEAGDVLNRATAVIREADSGVLSPTWMREAKDVVGDLKEAEAGAREPTKTLIQQYRKELERAFKEQAPKPPEKPQARPEPEPEPAPQPEPTPAVEPAPGPPEGESEAARRLREKREAAAKRKAPEGGVPRPTVSPTPGNQPPPVATERPVVGRPAPTERPAGGVSKPGGKFGGRAGARGAFGGAPGEEIQGLATPIGGQGDLANLFVLGGAVYEEGHTDPAAWIAEMRGELVGLGKEELTLALPAIHDLVKVAVQDEVYDVNDLRDMLDEGIAAYSRVNGDRAAWDAAMEPILGAEEGVAYQEPLYRLVQSYLGEGGPSEEAVEEQEPAPPGVEDGRAPEAVPPAPVPEAPGEREPEPIPPAEGGPPGGPVREPGGGGGEPTGGAGAPGAGGLPSPGGEHGFGDPGQPRVPAVTPGRDIILTEEILQLGRGPAQRFRENVEAIKLLRELQAENRQATPEEQRALAKFVGWGGLRNYFRENNPHKRTLLDLLSSEEYQAALESSDAAFYTDPVIAWKVWDLVRRLGFTGGRVLEPSGGIGLFFGTQPDAEASKRVSVELEPISAAIFKQLYPQALVHHEGFEDHVTADNFFDLTIGNPPFSEAGVHDASPDRRYQRAGLANSLHDFFFAKGLDKVRPGGLLVYITSTGTMDKVNANVREWLAQRAELVGAIRLPIGAMSRYGTEIGTDIIVLKKRPAPISREQAKSEPWMSVVELSREQLIGVKQWIPPAQTWRANAYWLAHPEHVIGAFTPGERYVSVLTTKLEDMNQLPAELDRVIATFPEGAMDARPENPATDPTNPETIRFLLPEAGSMPKPGGYAVRDGELWINLGAQDDAGRPVLTSVEDYTPGEIRTVAGILGVRDAAREVLRAQFIEKGDDAMRVAQAELNRVYDAHLAAQAIPATKATKTKPATPARPGYLHNRNQVSLISEDPDWGFILSLEVGPNINGHWDKADIFSKRTIPRLEDINRAETPQDAMLLSLARTGRLDWPLMTSLYPQSPGPSPVGMVTAFTHPADPRMHPQFVPTTAELLQEALGDAIYLNPETGAWETDDAYLSGNVRTKLAAAEAATKIDGKYQRNVDRLRGVIPEDIPVADISMDLGEALVPPEVVADFANEIFATRGVRVTFVPALSLWTVRTMSGDRELHNVPAQTQWGTSRVNGLVLLEMTLNNKLALVKDRVGEKKYVTNKEQTRRARLIQGEMRERFSGRDAQGVAVGTGWIWEDEKRAAPLHRAYNEKYNAIVNRTYRAPRTMTFPGLNPGWAELMRPSQKDDVWRILVGGNTLITRIVGSGKTLIMSAAMLEGKRLGTWQKPMMVVPNPIMKQTEASLRSFYPAANILVADAGSLGAGRRERFLGQIATGNWDVILVPHSSFGLISVSPRTQQAYIEERIEELMIALHNAGGSDADVEGDVAPKRKAGDSPTVREIATQIRRWRKKLRDLMAKEKGKRSAGLNFEELGVDALFVDEAHYFKNLKLPSHLTNVAGLPSTESSRAIDLHMKSRLLAARNGERGLVLATGTPVNNSLLETYVMLSYLMPNRLKAMGMYPLDTWLASYARVSIEMEFNAQGRFANKARLRRFKNIPELVQLFREVATEQGTAADLGLKVPTLRGDPQTDLSEDQVQDVAAGAIAGGDPTIGSDNFWLTFPKKVRVRQSVMSTEEIAASQEISERAAAIERGGIDPRNDNMLKLTGDARRLTLDGRLYDPTMPENPKGKLAVGADTIAEILARTAQTPHWDHASGAQRVDEAGNPVTFRGVVVGFMDIATPKAKAGPAKKGQKEEWHLTLDEFVKKNNLAESGREIAAESHYSIVLAAIQGGETIPDRVLESMREFPRFHQGAMDAIRLRDNEGADAEENVEAETVPEILARNQAYGALKEMLVARGVPANEIAFIHEAKNQAEKQALIERVNRGEVRVILGSTDKMGVGTNMQEQLVAEVDFDAPWRPGDIEQRLGRILRPGNKAQSIEVYRIIQAGAAPGLASADAYFWQVLEAKAMMQSTIMRGKVTVREIDDVGASLVFQSKELMGVASGDPRIQERANLMNEQARLQILHRNEQTAREAMKRQLSLNFAEKDFESLERHLKNFEADAAAWSAQHEGAVALTIDGTEHTGQAAIDAALDARVKAELDKWEKRLPLGEGAPNPIAIATYRGFEVLIKPFKGANGVMSAQLYTRGPSGVLEDHRGPAALLNLNRVLGSLPTEVVKRRQYLAQKYQDKERIERDLAKPEQYGGRLREVNTRIAEIERALGINQAESQAIEDDEDSGDDEDNLYTDYFTQDLAPPPTDREQQSALLHEDYQALTSAAGQAVQHATSQQSGADLTRPDVLITEMMEFIRQMGLGGISTTGGFQGRAGVHGYRDLMSGNLHVRRITDLDVAAHEFGHFIQRHLFAEGELRPFASELRAARQQVFGSNVSQSGRAIEEGFAEFVRLWLTDTPTAQQIAPTLLPEFERRLLIEPRVPGLDEAMSHFQRQAHELARASIEERLTAMFATGENANDQTVWRAARQGNFARARAVALDKFTAAWGHWMQGLADRQRAYRTFTAAADPNRTLPASEEPDKLAAQAPSRSVYALKVFLERGILDPITGDVDESASYAKVLNLIDPTGSSPDALGRFDVYAVLRRVLYLEGKDRVARPLGTTEGHRNAALHIRGMLKDLEQANWVAGFLPPTGGVDKIAEAVDRIDQEYPDFDAALMMLTKVEHGVLEYARKLGHYSEADMNNILLMNELYVPLWKIMDNTEQGRGKELSGLQLTAGETSTARVGRLHALKGDKTQAPLQPPLTSSVKNMQAIISAAERNAVAAAIWKSLGRVSEEVLERQRQRNAKRAQQGLPQLALAEASGEDVATLGRWAERVPPPQAAVTVKVGQMRKAVVEGFIDSGLTRAQAEAIAAIVPPEVWDHTATIFHMASTDDALKKGIVAVYVDGERRWLKINDVHLFESMLAVDRAITQAFLEDVNAIVRWASKSARLFRWGTVTHPGFIMANLVRDWMTSAASAKGVTPHAARGLGAGLSAAIDRPSEAAHQFGIAGGEMFPQFPQNDKRLRKYIKQLAYEERTERARLMSRWRTAKHGGRIADQLLNLTEMSTRYGVYKAELKTPRPQDLTERDRSTHAAYLARLATYDWAKMGSLPWVQAWSATVPFMRAGINVSTQFPQKIARNPWRHAFWLFGLLIARLIAHWMGKGDPRYDEKSATEQVLSLTLIWPGSHKTAEEAAKLTGPARTAWLNQAYKLPVEQGLALPSSIIMAAWGAYEKGGSVLGSAWSALSKGAAVSMMPPAVSFGLSTQTGRNWFFDRPVVPQGMVMQKLPPGEQRFPWTSPIALEVASLGRKAGVADLSPIWIDEFIQGFFGRVVSGTAQSILPNVLEALGLQAPGPTKPERATWGHFRTWPGISRFTSVYPTWRAQSINDLYDFAASAASAKSGEKNARDKRGTEAAQEFLSEGDYGFWIKGYPSGVALSASQKISRLHKEAIAIEANRRMTDPVKKQQDIDDLLMDAIVEAQTANARIRNAKKQWLEKGRP